MLARPGRFDRGVERQQVGLPGDRLDQADDLVDLLRRIGQSLNRRVGPLRLLHGVVGDPGRAADLSRDLLE